LKGVGKKYPRVKNTNGAFNDFWPLEGIFLSVKKGEIIGIIGRNGAGKTTLLNIIAGVVAPTKGEICINGRIKGLFNLGAGFQDELSGRENIFLNGAILGETKEELKDKLAAIIEFSELGEFIDMPLGTYSQGMRLRLGFSIVANLNFDILVIDEILAVGDILFQNKCFEKITDFKRQGKTLIITNQSAELVARLCDKAVLLDHGKLLFAGDVKEAVEKYRALLNKEQFFVGPAKASAALVEDTKKWADDRPNWGKILGTKEVVLEKVSFLGRYGRHSSAVKSGKRLRINVHFKARNNLKEPHFGVAIFRNDGVYCYGPNTAFDGYKMSRIQPGSGQFSLEYDKILLAPGGYRVSVAIWDKGETLPFIHHYAYYNLTVAGYKNINNELINIPFRFRPRHNFFGFSFFGKKFIPDLSVLSDKWGKKIEGINLIIGSFRIANLQNEEKQVFMTGSAVKFTAGLNKLPTGRKSYYCWLGIYRADGILCQGFSGAFCHKDKTIDFIFPRLGLLPGGYKVSVCVWNSKKELLAAHHGVYSFKTVFNKNDHGTVFLEHKWGLNGYE